MRKKILVVPPDYDGPVPVDCEDIETDDSLTRPEIHRTETISRQEVSDHTEQTYRDAKANNDVWTALDALYTILTGEQP